MSHVIYVNVIHHLEMSFVIYRCHPSFINAAYVLYFGTNGAPYILVVQAPNFVRHMLTVNWEPCCQHCYAHACSIGA